MIVKNYFLLFVPDRIKFLFVITLLSSYLCFINVTLGTILFFFLSWIFYLWILVWWSCRWRAAKCRPMLGANCLWAGRDLYRAISAVTQDVAFAAFGLGNSYPHTRFHARLCRPHLNNLWLSYFCYVGVPSTNTLPVVTTIFNTLLTVFERKSIISS